ncbi:MAG: flavin reductase family protein [Planctomycetes bacterium]|jgi:flavin reductase (DIM6/NTAB) family NADH-FMN oxidoreductase RutF|nr:flavin reductase family protein [Planctomycetota bacterium]
MKKSVGAKTILYPHPVLVVGSYDEADRPNLMTVAWGGICCSKPPAVAISVREATKTYHNVKLHGAFTVNIPSRRQVRESDWVGIVSGRDVDKFAKAGLTPVKSALVHAPYVGEFPLVLECRVLKTVEIGLHTQFVGEILDVKADESVLGANGLPDVEKVKPMLYATGNQAYYAVGEMIAKAFTVKEL